MLLSNKAKAYMKFCVSIIASLGLGAAFLVTREKCLSKKTFNFIDTGYCRGLSDSRARALTSWVITGATLLIGWALGNAVCAYRTKCLERGISEGVYVALGGQAWRYQVSAIFTHWCPLILVVVLLSYGPSAFQPLLNLAQTSEVIFEKSDASVTLRYSTPSLYNVTLPKNLRDELFASDVGAARDVLSYLPLYSSGSNAFASSEMLNNVTSGVARASLIFKKQLGMAGLGVGGLVVRFNETLANVTSRCTFTSEPERIFPITDKPLQELGAGNKSVILAYPLQDTGKGYDFTTGFTASFNMSTESAAGLQTFKAVTELTEFDLLQGHREIFQNLTLYHRTTCWSEVTLKESEAVMNIASLNITTLLTHREVSTVPSGIFSEAVANTIRTVVAPLASEGTNLATYQTGLYRQIQSCPLGLFESSLASFMHSQLCAAVSWTLQGLYYEVYSSGGTVVRRSTDLNATFLDYYDYQIEGEDVWADDHNITSSYSDYGLYAPTSRSFMRRAVAWGFVVAFVGLNVLLCAVAWLYTYLARMNVKGMTENAFFDNLTARDIAVRRGDSLGSSAPTIAAAHSCSLSNDDVAQRRHAFGSMLYSSEYYLPHVPAPTVRVGFYPGIQLRQHVDYA